MKMIKIPFHYNLSQEVTLKCTPDKPEDKKKREII